jgi:hypothetical protein
MLDNVVAKKIENFVCLKPRSIQEIAGHLGKNWRTVDRYVQEIEKNFGTLGIRIFREGTRGALKIVYWAGIEKASHSVFQDQLEKMIMRASGKEDFSAFDIFQYVPDKYKTAWMRYGEKEDELGKLDKFRDLLLKTKKQILFFSGNLSFINYKSGNVDVFEIINELVKKGICIKVVCRVDLAGIDNIKKLLSLNSKYGKELIEIRHREQPLRLTVIDKDIVNMKEVKKPTGREKELNKKMFIFYDIKDKDWIEWISKIFWNMFSSSIDANKRLEEIEKLEDERKTK